MAGDGCLVGLLEKIKRWGNGCRPKGIFVFLPIICFAERFCSGNIFAVKMLL